MKNLLVVLFLLSGAACAADDKGAGQDGPSLPVAHVDGHPVYGEMMPAGESIGLAAAAARAGDYAATPAKFSGRITKVCKRQGCWMIIADGHTFARVDFNDHAFLIPKDSAGDAEVFGTLNETVITEEQRRHYAAESGRDPAKIHGDRKELEIVATSVWLLGS